MSFFSTRGGACVTASQAILTGLSSDGGLFVPSMFPLVSNERILQFGSLPYPARASRILRYFLEDYFLEEIDAACEAAYATGAFDDPAVAPVKPLDDRTYVMELFHGPTLAFKDVALQALPHFLRMAAEKNDEAREIAVLVATSGDTGKAALEGFKDVAGTSCTVFYPEDGVSAIQKLQMTTTGGGNTRVVGVRGNFDDAQTGLKRLFTSEEFRARMSNAGRTPAAANSINFGRLVPQIVYYFSAYADLVRKGIVRPFQPIHFAVPTGNFGNILAAYYARQMGLPIDKLICASNRNNVLTDFFRTGRYSVHRTFFKTLSPSMDILVSSNLERLLYEMADRDPMLINWWMDELKRGGEFNIGEARCRWLRQLFYGAFADDLSTRQEIARVFERFGYLMDPHTAVASYVLGEYRRETGDLTPTVIAATASPYKFTPDVLGAIAGADAAKGLDAFQCARRLAERTGTTPPAQVLALESLPVRHTMICDADRMGDAVLA